MLKTNKGVFILIIVLLIISSVLALIGLTFNNKEEINDSSIIMNVKEGTLTNSGLTLILINNTDNEYIYGESYHIERKENNHWVVVEGLSNIFNMPRHTLNAHETVEVIKDWGWQIDLPAGEYRINKEFNQKTSEEINRKSYTVYVEFTLK